MERAEGAYFWDVDGNKYIDYLAAYGPIITGHAHPHITKAITMPPKQVSYMVHQHDMKLSLLKC